jgi:FMN reductase
MNSLSMKPGTHRPYIVGLGGSLRTGSGTEKCVRIALEAARQAGAETLLIEGPDLELPMYDYGRAKDCPAARRLIRELRRANGIILASPGYHGSISGLMKNAIDYIEEMSKDPAPYLHGRAVGCIATAGGWPGAMTTLSALRDIVHALRGWPTPLGVAINSSEPLFDPSGKCLQEKTQYQLEYLGQQVAEFALHPSHVKPRHALAAWAYTPFFDPLTNPVPGETMETAWTA